MSDHAMESPDARTAAESLPEGEEAPPPGARIMGTVRWVLVAIMAALAAATWVHWADLGPRVAGTSVRYHCPMHPAVVQERPGECPICGMDLVLAEAGGGRDKAPVALAAAVARQAPDEAQRRYWCPMHPEVMSDDPHATCPKCGGMKLVPRDPSALAKAAAAAGAGAYWCPMHPEVTSDDPHATCPKCGGMKLMPRPGPSGRPGGPVPGLTPVEVSAERTQLMGMRTAQVTRRRLAPQLRTVGFVSANESSLAIITTRFTGWVEDLRVAQSGQRVNKGQVLATIYSPELLTAQQVYLNALKWTDQRNAQSSGQSGGLEGEARKRLELLGIAREDVTELSRRGKPLEAMPIRSPVGGYVAKKAALPGLYVQPGSELFQIADLSTVWVVADVYESDMSRIQVGQDARLLLGAYPGEAFTGRVQFIYPAVNPESRTLQARMEFKNPGLKLRPGMYGDVVIELASAEGLAVPTEAVVDTGEVQYVFLARGGGRFEPRVVRLGNRGEGLVQLLEGVSAGDVVVTTANFLIDSESRLRAAVESFAPVLAHEEAKEHEPDDRREHGRH